MVEALWAMQKSLPLQWGGRPRTIGSVAIGGGESGRPVHDQHQEQYPGRTVEGHELIRFVPLLDGALKAIREQITCIPLVAGISISITGGLGKQVDALQSGGGTEVEKVAAATC